MTDSIEQRLEFDCATLNTSCAVFSSLDDVTYEKVAMISGGTSKHAFHLQVDGELIGQTIYFKFCAEGEALSSARAYKCTVTSEHLTIAAN